MDSTEFEKIKTEFIRANTDKKIEIYATTPGLNKEQYKELLRLYPFNEIDKLEEALA